MRWRAICGFDLKASEVMWTLRRMSAYSTFSNLNIGCFSGGILKVRFPRGTPLHGLVVGVQVRVIPYLQNRRVELFGDLSHVTMSTLAIISTRFRRRVAYLLSYCVLHRSLRGGHAGVGSPQCGEACATEHQSLQRVVGYYA